MMEPFQTNADRIDKLVATISSLEAKATGLYEDMAIGQPIKKEASFQEKLSCNNGAKAKVEERGSSRSPLTHNMKT
jgi:hypothetical protein